jgi:hypothetical protein
LAAVVLLAFPAFLLLPVIMPKPWPLPAPGSGVMTINLDYHEPLGDYRDVDAARARVYTQAQKDCEAAGKSFGKRCVITAVTISAPQDEDSQIPPIVSGHAQLTLYPDDKATAPGKAK